MTADTGYPEHLAGADADPPGPVAPRVLEMARRVAARNPDEPLTYAAGAWRLAASLLAVRAELDAAAPHRDRSSDGTIGNARHAALGAASDHNPWLNGVVRALDIDTDGVDLPAAFERARVAAAAGTLPALTGGGYLILNGRITAEDFSRWKVYTGSNPHVTHGHVSVSRDPARYDSRDPWGIFTPPAKPSPARPRPAPARWTGPDLTGTGTSLRGDQGDNGPRVAAWQQWLNTRYPLYSKLAVDGQWGAKTTAVNREFARRSGVASADGRNIGPRLAAAYWRAGLFRNLSAAQVRAASHVARGTRR